jgi:ABC-type lipoprotein export system ATPase subunit
MSRVTIHRSVDVESTGRVLQLLGMFDVPPSKRSEQAWSFEFPFNAEPWQIGLIVGPSGSGKTTVARELFDGEMIHGYDWPTNRTVVDGFPEGLGIKDITAALSSVGFSSPPSWLRPFRCLSNGEQFRATLARALVDPRPRVVVDEFTSVVDRTVAQIGSAAVAKAVRRQPGKQFIAVTCHDDVEPWLCPDWVVRMPSGEFARRSLRRPSIELDIRRVETSAWKLFKHHHYLDASLHPAARCFVAHWRGRPVAFASAIHSPGKVSWWREHRTVCLPDFQGVGVGNALSEFVAGVMACLGKAYRSTTSSPAMIRHRNRSPLWRMDRAPSRMNQDNGKKAMSGEMGTEKTRSYTRLTAGFKYIGPQRWDDARRMGII